MLAEILPTKSPTLLAILLKLFVFLRFFLPFPESRSRTTMSLWYRCRCWAYLVVSIEKSDERIGQMETLEGSQARKGGKFGSKIWFYPFFFSSVWSSKNGQLSWAIVGKAKQVRVTFQCSKDVMVQWSARGGVRLFVAQGDEEDRVRAEYKGSTNCHQDDGEDQGHQPFPIAVFGAYTVCNHSRRHRRKAPNIKDAPFFS